jgi:hypothetical protein
VIFFDAFGSGAIPFHLVTREVFALAKAHLSPGGILLANVEGVGWDDVLVRGVGATMATQFQKVLALPIAEPPNQVGNLILVAADRTLEISDAALGNPADYMADDYLQWTIVQRNHAWANRFPLTQASGPVLTDDLDPVDLWAENVNRTARRELHRLFGRDTPTW